MVENKTTICPTCLGSGVIELRPDYIITCYECAGKGVKEQNEETS